MSNWYILDDDHNPVPSTSEEWTSWSRSKEHEGRLVARHSFWKYNVLISTVFLGLDHSSKRMGAPVLFETLIFGGPLSGEGERYCTWDQARAGHVEWLIKVLTNGLIGEKP